jgi:preprotein translocase subunit SecG
LDFSDYLNIAQLLISVLLIVVVLLQVRGTDVGAAFGGGGGGGSSYRTRRGLEKTLFQLTIVLAIIFVGISALSVRYFDL